MTCVLLLLVVDPALARTLNTPLQPGLPAVTMLFSVPDPLRAGLMLRPAWQLLFGFARDEVLNTGEYAVDGVRVVAIVFDVSPVERFSDVVCVSVGWATW
jgi:hypothetical protein